MSEWRETTLEEVATEVTVGYVGPMASEYLADGIPFLRSQNVDPLTINREDLKFVSPDFHARLKKSTLSPGDVVIVRTGKPGACAVVPPTLPKANCSDLVIIRCGSDLDPRFLAYYVNSVAVHHVNSHLVGAVQQHFNVGSARKMRLRLPVIQEQRAIVDILGSLDDKIELNRRINETLEAMARAIFKSWFVDFDPVRAKMEGRKPAGMSEEIAALFPDSFLDSPMGKIPKGWQAKSLSEVVDLNPPRPLKKGVEAPYLDMKMMPTRGHHATGAYLRPFGSGSRFQNGDTLVARITPCLENGKTSLVDFLSDGQTGWGSTEYIVMRQKPPIPKYWGYLLARSEDFRQHAIQSMTGSSGRQRVPISCFEQFLVPLPDTPVFQAFGGIVSSVAKRITQTGRETEGLAALRDALLPKLISGNLRVDNLAETAIS